MRKLLTREQAAEILQVSISFLKLRIRENQIPIVKLGNLVRIDEVDLWAYVDSSKKDGVKTGGTPRGEAQSGGVSVPVETIEKTVVSHR
jgi:excisionase family DNA binding protein